MLAALGTLIMVLTTVIPLLFTIAKVFPRLLQIVRYIFTVGRGTNPQSRSIFLGFIVFVFTFVGGLGFLVSIYFGWGLELYLKFFDFVFTPFAYIVQNLLSSFISHLPALPSNTASVLCLFDFGSCFTLFFMGFSFEVYMRIVIYFLVRRGK